MLGAQGSSPAIDVNKSEESEENDGVCVCVRMQGNLGVCLINAAQLSESAFDEIKDTGFEMCVRDVHHPP